MHSQQMKKQVTHSITGTHKAAFKIWVKISISNKTNDIIFCIIMTCGAVTGHEKTELVLKVNRISLFVVHLTNRIQVTNEKYCTKRPYRNNGLHG